MTEKIENHYFKKRIKDGRGSGVKIQRILSSTASKQNLMRKVLSIRPKGLIYSWFSWCCTARGSGTGLSQVGPAWVKASKSVLFTEGSPEVEIKNICLIK